MAHRTKTPSGHVFDLPVIDVEEQGVQGEVAPKGILLRCSEGSFRDAAVRPVDGINARLFLLFQRLGLFLITRVVFTLVLLRSLLIAVR